MLGLIAGVFIGYALARWRQEFHQRRQCHYEIDWARALSRYYRAELDEEARRERGER